MSLPTLTGIGRLVDDPELRYTSSGKAVTRLRLAFSARRKDPQTQEWVDGDKCFLDATLWDQAAESAAESLTKGIEVLVSGQLKQRTYEDREGNNRTVFELAFAAVGPSLRYATAKVQKMQRSGGSGYAQTSPAPGADDPWATSAAPAGTALQDTEPPF
jgi:single-strand DNA-binding protein